MGKRMEEARSRLHQNHGVCCISGRLSILRGPFGQLWLICTVGCSPDAGRTGELFLKEYAEATNEVKAIYKTM